MNRFGKAFMALLLLITLIAAKPVIAQADDLDGKKVLIINSYHKGMVWTDDQTQGIMDAFGASGISATLFTEYMDWKRNPTLENQRIFLENIRNKYERASIDLVMTTDDAALKFALDHRQELFPEAPIIFSGVNPIGIKDLIGSNWKVTGVTENIDPTATINAALTVNPKLSKVYLAFDQSESGKSTGALVTEKINAMNLGLTIIPMDSLSYEQMIEQARQLNKEDSIILMTTYYHDSTGRTAEFDKIAQALSDSSQVPVYHLYDFGLNHGAVGGSMLSGTLQGKEAAALAVRVLGGANPDGIPIVSNPATRLAFDYNVLKRLDIPLSKLPKGSEVINRPFSFYETYKAMIYVVLGSFISLIVLILILLGYIRLIRNMRRKLARSHERFLLATEGAGSVVWDLDMTTMRYYFSDRWYELLGYEKEELAEAFGGWKWLIHPEDAATEERVREAHVQGKTPFFECEYRMITKSGDYKWIRARGKVIRDENGEPVRMAGSMLDVTEQKGYEVKLQASYDDLEASNEELTTLQEELMEQFDMLQRSEERLHELAYFDELSKLPNKLSLFEELRSLLADGACTRAALYNLDVDNFKYFNDTMGYFFGDKLLSQVGERLRSLSNGQDYAFRFSGDEFVILLKDVESDDDVLQFAESLVNGFRDPLEVLDATFHISVSVGISQYPKDGNDPESLLKFADIAMHRAKEPPKGKYALYDSSMQAATDERMIMEKHLRNALSNGELSLHYQPQYNLRSGFVSGFEALIRWDNPELGRVSPLSFIRVAEDSWLIVTIGEWVLRSACHFIKSMHNRGHAGYQISVNLSVVQLMQEDFVDMVLRILDETELAPEFLEIEITESVIIQYFEESRAKLNRLRSVGVRIALDDFGTGYSSLSYLKQLPITTLKVDKSFIDSIPDMSIDRSLTDAILTIGDRLGLDIVAEGVESYKQFRYLKRTKCIKVQGYYISRPIPENEVVAWIEAGPFTPPAV
ncbi:ABC transporter substrate binding protein [Gorillibacterium massiliense]|uniref:ABC transporter substrate binding protein n=1 Tax=Gorillibacterium massiliense TaxID=1280390 RepID=UPI0004AFAB2F|nr:ABC transporter substrate binding protein [Gorillibacterium massiliense]